MKKASILLVCAVTAASIFPLFIQKSADAVDISPEEILGNVQASTEYDPKDYSTWNDLLTYQEKKDGTILIFSSYDTEKDGGYIEKIEVPNEIDGKPVTEIADSCFREMDRLTEVSLPDSVLKVDDNAFYKCTALEKVNIPKNLENIGEKAFYGCSALKSAQIPKAVEKIGDYAFEGCDALTAIDVDKDNKNYSSDDGILFNKDRTCLIRFPQSSSITDYVLPNSVTEIANWSFVGCTKLESCNISNSKLSKIGEDAFYYCTSLKEMEVPENITSLDGAVFSYCVAMKSISLPQSLKSVGNYCFYGCTSIESVTLPSKLEEIGDYAFYSCTSLKELSIPASVKKMGKYSVGYNMDVATQKEAKASGFKIIAKKGTKGYLYAQKNGFAFPWNLVILIAAGVLAAAAAFIIIRKLIRRKSVSKANFSKKSKKNKRK